MRGFYGGILLVLIILFAATVSAGVGIKWDRQGAIVEQGSKTCLTYNLYNPWPEDSYAKIEVSDPLKEVLKYQEMTSKLIPAQTSSAEAIPMEFCFEVPYVYQAERNCLIGDKYFCKQTCNEPQKSYSGEVLVMEAKTPSQTGGSGGSATAMAVSAPLVLKVSCQAEERDYRPLYGLAILLLVIVLIALTLRHNGKPKSEQYKEEIAKLEKKLKAERKKNK